MTLEKETEMHERFKSHWQQLGNDERIRRQKLMKQAAKLSSYFAEGLVRVSKFDGDNLHRLQRLFQMAERRYRRRAISYFGE